MAPRFPTVAAAAAGAALAIGGLTGFAAAEPSESLPTASDIAGLFDRWNGALSTGDATRVTDEYAPEAVLLPTVSNNVRTDRAEIQSYFADQFLPEKPQGTITESYIQILDADTAMHNGTYDLRLTDSSGATSVVPARFTFVYEKVDGNWLIAAHHSSAMPEK